MGYGMKYDSKGLTYYDETSKGELVTFTNIADLTIKNNFYKLLDNPNYIIKKADNLDINRLMMMLTKFNELNSIITKTDLPLSYYIENNKVEGTVIPYYPDTTPLYTISKTRTIGNLVPLYNHDEDRIRNVFCLYNDILDIFQELLDYGVFYYDSNSTNFVFSNNEVKLIDFDPKRVLFGVNKKEYKTVIDGLYALINLMTQRFFYYDEVLYFPRSIEGMRKHLVKLENKVRKR